MRTRASNIPKTIDERNVLDADVDCCKMPSMSPQREIVERYFEIRAGIMLGFFNGREQYDKLIEAGQGYLMFDGCDIYWVLEGQQLMSDTINEAISIWLDQGLIEEVVQRPLST